MYNLPEFKATNNEDVIAFMHAHPFITLCGSDKNGAPVATQVPVLFEERDGKMILMAHIMRDQDHTKAFEENNQVLALFTGANTYVSASWYKHKNLGSTWNYKAVHAHGTLRFTDEAALYNLLVKLTAHFEQPDSPSLVKDMKPGYVKKLMQYIVAFEIEVTDIKHVFKLSQNRDEESYSNILQQLHAQPNAAAKQVAEDMEQNKSSMP